MYDPLPKLSFILLGSHLSKKKKEMNKFPHISVHKINSLWFPKRILNYYNFPIMAPGKRWKCHIYGEDWLFLGEHFGYVIWRLFGFWWDIESDRTYIHTGFIICHRMKWEITTFLLHSCSLASPQLRINSSHTHTQTIFGRAGPPFN